MEKNYDVNAASELTLVYQTKCLLIVFFLECALVDFIVEYTKNNADNTIVNDHLSLFKVKIHTTFQ